MVEHDLLIAGFGGQGVQLAGQVLAEAAVKDGKHAAYISSYGAETRGGTSKCYVAVDAAPIDCPFPESPATYILLNRPSVRALIPEVARGGTVIYNASLIKEAPERQHLRVLGLPLNDLALSLGNERVLNIIALGAYLGLTRAVASGAVEAALEEAFGLRKHDALAVNLQALSTGLRLGESWGAPA